MRKAEMLRCLAICNLICFQSPISEIEIDRLLHDLFLRLGAIQLSTKRRKQSQSSDRSRAAQYQFCPRSIVAAPAHPLIP
jgi:hypothetical protein